jgi:hypothetical protein
MVICAKIASYYRDKDIPVEVGYRFLDNCWQVEFRLSFTVDNMLLSSYQDVSLEFIESRDPSDVVEGLLAQFETAREYYEKELPTFTTAV